MVLRHTGIIPICRTAASTLMLNPAVVVIVILATCIPGLRSFGQDVKKETSVLPKSGFRAEYLKQLDDVESKMITLAELFPQKKYGWRPMKGVRSVSEVFVHVSASNYLFPQFAGFKPAASLGKDPEKNITQRTRIIADIRESFAFLRRCLLELPDADLDRKAKMFGDETTVRGIFFGAAVHMHEHLGQMIAYARTNHLIPPWSAADNSSR